MKITSGGRLNKWLLRQCPFCHSQLNVAEYTKRKILKVCRCGKCGRVIDDRLIIH